MQTIAVPRVLVIDDHHMLRVGLKALAQAAGVPMDWTEAGNLDDGLCAYAKMLQTQPADLVLLDLNLPDSQGLQGLTRFRNNYPEARIAIFSATDDSFVIRQIAALGAVGFVSKSASAESSLRQIRSLLGSLHEHADSDLEQAGSTASNTASSTAGRWPVTLDPLDARARHVSGEHLSPTQLRVLELVLAGMSNREIASECSLAIGTVKNTVSSILLALDVRSRAHLISMFR